MKSESDKFRNGLMCEYTSVIEPLKYMPIRLLEIGIFRGDSLRFWAQYFKHPETQIVGLDIEPPRREFGANVTVYKCDQSDAASVTRIADAHGPFDLIIDDGAHFRRETETCFRVLFDRVVIGGYYVIEDWAAGYWKDRPEYAGMVELVTDLVHRTPELKIESFKIVLAPGKSMALFRRGDAGWTD